jgi:protein gp37
MADKSKIEWTEATWNPIRGCSKVSEGCRNCYAEKVAARFSGVTWAGPVKELPYSGLITDGHWNGTVRLVPDQLEQPLRWRRPRRIFVNSMSDLFHESLPFEQVDRIFGVMAAACDHTFQLLTKRAGRMAEYLCQDRRSQWAQAGANGDDQVFDRIHLGPMALPNIWLGVSVENQYAADERIPALFLAPAAVRWISAEPLLGPVDLSGEYLADMCGGKYPFPCLSDQHRTKRIDRLDWVVCGGESGAQARPMHPDWARGLRDQCSAAGVPFLFKQHGEWGPSAENMLDGTPTFRVFRDADHWWAKGSSWMSKGDIILDAAGKLCASSGDIMRGQAPFTAMRRIGKKAAGRLLDGQLHDGYPEVTHG